MANLSAIFAIVLLAGLMAANAEPPRFRTSRRNGQIRTNIRYLQRQEAEEPAVVEPAVADAAPAPASTSAPAPYPAAGVTPEVPFELPTETEASVPDTSYGPPTEGEEDITEQTVPAVEEVPEESADLLSENIIQPRLNRLLRAQAIPLQLRAAPGLRQGVPRGGAVYEIIRSEPILVYTLK